MKTFLAVLVIALAGCYQYEPGGARNIDDMLAHAKHLREKCKPNGWGFEGVHGGGLNKSEIFVCPDGTLGFLPQGFGK